MKKYTVTFLFSLLLFVLFISYSIEAFSQESEDAQQQSEDNTSLQQEEDDTPAALDEILDNKETQPEGSSDSPATTKDSSDGTKDSENAVADEPAVRISKVKIEGAKIVTKQQIEQVIGTEFPSIKFWVKKPPYDEEVLKDDMIRIQRLYANNGYYDTKATYEPKYNKDETRVEIKITIEEGEPVVLTDIDLKIEGNLSDKIKKQINKSVPLVIDKTFSPNGYQQTKGVISEILSNNGYPKSDIEGEALVNRREKWARAKFVVKPGLIYKFGVIKVEGNEDVASRIVEREAEFKEGEIFSLSKINKTQANIFQLGLFRSVVIDPVYNDEEQIADVAIVVKERKQGSVKIGGGFGTEDKLRGQAIWTQRNFFGGGRRLEVSGKFSFITQRFEASVIQPFIAGKNSELSGTLNFQRDDVPSFKGRSFLSTAALSKDFWKYYSVFSSLNLQFSRIVDSATRTPEERSRENFFLTFINFGFSRDTTDNVLNPSRGTVVSTGLESSFTALGSDVNYLKGTIELRGYKKYRDIVFAKKFTIGVIQPFGSTQTLDIPIFKRFFAGGSTSMRGFPFQKLGPLDENNDPLGGNSLLVGSFEVRHPIYGDFGGVAFLDYGNVYTDEWSFPLQDIKYAPGVGLRYDTIIGPVRFDVGYALNPEPGIRRIQFFISIGQAF
jgi:outer membrane protein insertion porin family